MFFSFRNIFYKCIRGLLFPDSTFIYFRGHFLMYKTKLTHWYKYTKKNIYILSCIYIIFINVLYIRFYCIAIFIYLCFILIFYWLWHGIKIRDNIVRGKQIMTGFLKKLKTYIKHFQFHSVLKFSLVQKWMNHVIILGYMRPAKATAPLRSCPAH